MIKVYDKNKNFIKGTLDYASIKIEEEISVSDVLVFEVPFEFSDIFEEEGYIEVKNEGSFVIKEKNLTGNGVEIVCKQNLEDLACIVPNKVYATKTMQYILNDLLSGTGWTGIADTNISRTVTGSNMSVLDYIYKAIDIFKYEVKFDSVNKKVIAREKIGSDKGVYFHDEVNLKSTNISSDTYDFVTRIIPIGFDGLGIELINGGKSYVENHSYSNKIITLEWRDERYTVAENLKRDAELKLEKLCRPLRTYSCSIEDLSKSIDYKILHYEVGDTIDLIDREKGIREKQRIIKTVKYLNSEGEDSVEIANRPRIFGDDLNDKIEEANSNISATNSKLELLDDKIIAEVETINQSVTDNVKTINEKIGQLIITDSQISNMVSDLTTIVSENYNEVNNKIGKLDIKADNINASVSDLNTKVDGNKTETDNKIGKLDIKADSITASVSNLNTKVDANKNETNTRLEQAELKITSTAINATVSSQITEKVNGAITHTNDKFASLNTTINGISGRVTTLDTKVDGNITTTNERLGELELTDSKFETRISNAQSTANTANTNATNAKNTADSAYSVATQTATEITSKVSKGDIASTINQTAQGVKINANKISLVGAVSVLSDIAGNLGTINVGRLASGNIDIDLRPQFDDINIKAGALRLTNSNGQVVIDGSSNMLKIATEHTITIDAVYDLNYTESWYHGLGYVPNVMAYQVAIDNISGSGLSGATPLPAMSVGGGSPLQINTMVRVSVTADRIYINYVRATTSSGNRRATVKFYLMKEKVM